ncbi:hypothetical protein BXZ70DRAFT_1009361 [Cristinia sonorae]|uniref:Nuclear fusion protein KAR5 n=1 Tax=Cristinia sonorae TaxID=1940300 RepID=A0A8K0UN22_9AGAR|nr:hypothetical protein BXZ70DRAFT_1009361 [Cristinia sonorae]
MKTHSAVFSSIICLLLSANAAASALSWFKAANDPSRAVTRADSQHTSAARSSTQEIETMILHAERIQLYSRRPDCFQRVTGTIKEQCGELELNEEERIKAAISMTLCELKTALHSPPMECSSFVSSINSDDPFDPKTCVEALSRSAQYWSSYSGYLREVPQLCFAFRRWNDIDTAKEIYRNATSEKLSLLRLLLSREIAMNDNQEHMLRAMNEMHALLANLETISTTVEAASEEAAMALQGRADTLLDMVQQELRRFRQASETSRRQDVEELNLAVSDLLKDHTISLSSMVPRIEALIRDNVDDIFSRSQQQFQSIFNGMHIVHKEWTALGQEIYSLQESLRHLTASTHAVASQFEDKAGEALRVHLIEQQSATDSALRLAEVLTDLTVKAEDEIKSINGTAMAVREGLLIQNQVYPRYFSLGDWGRTALLWLLEIVLRVDSRHLDYVFRLPVFQLFGALATALGYLVRFLLSMSMSIGVLLFSARRWLKVSEDRSQHSVDPYRRNKMLSEYRNSVVSSKRLFAPSVSGGPGSSLRRSRSNATVRMSRIPDRLVASSASRASGF